MRKLLYILLFLTLSVVISCNRSVDKRLVLADTLMWVNPDSSLTILQGINRDSLQGDENKAYYALLRTQARFRVDYYDYPSDSLINIALEHYSDNHNREHNTRALLYKGAYYEVHDNPTQAMRYYKMAEDNADTTDYRNLAQLNLRMGKLYYDNYASNNLDIEKFEKALRSYEKLHDKRMIMVTLEYIGNLYRDNNRSQAIKCLTRAKNIAKQINDSNSYYHNLNNLSMALFMDSAYLDSKLAAVECLNHSSPTNSMLFNAANAYALLGMTDSARFFINKVIVKSNNDYDSMMYNFSMAHILKAERNHNLAMKHEIIGNQIASRIEHKSQRNSIFETEDYMDTHLISNKHDIISSQRLYLTIAAFVCVVIIAITLILTIIEQHKHHSSIKILVNEKEKTNNLLKEYLKKDDEHNQVNLAIINYLQEHFNSLKTIIDHSACMKHSDFVKLMNKESRNFASNKNVDKLLPVLVNDKFNDLITTISQEHPSLTSNDIKLISLIALGYDNLGIAFCLGLTKESVRTKKTRIKNKMNIEMSLDNYVKEKVLLLKQS